MGLPAGVQVFSLLYQNPWLLTVIAKIMGMAPGLSVSFAPPGGFRGDSNPRQLAAYRRQ